METVPVDEGVDAIDERGETRYLLSLGDDLVARATVRVVAFTGVTLLGGYSFSFSGSSSSCDFDLSS